MTKPKIMENVKITIHLMYGNSDVFTDYAYKIDNGLFLTSKDDKDRKVIFYPLHMIKKIIIEITEVASES